MARTQLTGRLLVAASLATAAFFPALGAPPPDWLADDPGLYVDKGGFWVKAEWKDHADALDRLLAHCLGELQVPFDLGGKVIVVGEDDKDLTRERTRAKDAPVITHGPKGEPARPRSTRSHCGVDVGSRVSGGDAIATLGSASVSPIHTGGFVKVDSDGRLIQKLMCEHGGLRVVFLLVYGHVKPRAGLGRDWGATPAGRLGTLEGDDQWTSYDPKLPRKGNHIHLEVEGIYEKDFATETAHNAKLDGEAVSPEMDDFFRRRTRFFDELLRKVTGR